jgi:hypothetical protein
MKKIILGTLILFFAASAILLTCNSCSESSKPGSDTTNSNSGSATDSAQMPLVSMVLHAAMEDTTLSCEEVRTLYRQYVKEYCTVQAKMSTMSSDLCPCPDDPTRLCPCPGDSTTNLSYVTTIQDASVQVDTKEIEPGTITKGGTTFRSFTMPSDLGAGTHTLTIKGTFSGVQRTYTLQFEVKENKTSWILWQ